MDRSNASSPYTPNASIKKPPVSLLTLPVEIRKRIIRYSFLAACSASAEIDHDRRKIFVYSLSELTPSARARIDEGIYGFWGLEPMSRILRLNHQLHSEGVEVLYGGDFVFWFSSSIRVQNARFWLDVIGEQKSLVKHIGLQVVVDLELVSHSGSDAAEADEYMWRQKEAHRVLASELEGLHSVKIMVSFVLRLIGALLGRDRAVQEICSFAAIFGEKATFINDGHWTNQERTDLLESCKQKLEDTRRETKNP